MARHPWEITLRELIQIARRDYGIEIELVSAAVAGGWLLSKDGSVDFPVLVLDPDEIMPVRLVRMLCRLYGIPPEDLSLDPWEDES